MSKDRKMTLRPSSSTADIDALIANAGGGVPEEPVELERVGEPRPKSAPRPVRQTPVPKKARLGRPKKEKAEIRNQKVTLSLTEAERQKLKEKSGMAAEATYLLSVLRDAGVFD